MSKQTFFYTVYKKLLLSVKNTVPKQVHVQRFSDITIFYKIIIRNIIQMIVYFNMQFSQKVFFRNAT